MASINKIETDDFLTQKLLNFQKYLSGLSCIKRNDKLLKEIGTFAADQKSLALFKQWIRTECKGKVERGRPFIVSLFEGYSIYAHEILPIDQDKVLAYFECFTEVICDGK